MKLIQLLLLCCALLLIFAVNLSLGSVSIPFLEVPSYLWEGISSNEQSAFATILYEYRLPKALTAMLCGVALSQGGLYMQSLFQNPLAGPYVLGISSGASLGVALAILFATGLKEFFYSAFGLSLASYHLQLGGAILGSSLLLALILHFSHRIRSNTALLILGLMIGYVAGSLVSILAYFGSQQELQSFLHWSFGSFDRVPWERLPTIAIPIILCTLGSLFFLKSLNTLCLGESYAASLGVSVQRTRQFLLLSTSVLAGTVTAFCGPVAFIGIAVPHLTRILFQTQDHRILVPACSVLGACLCLISDTLSQLPGSSQTLPLNAITSLIGAPLIVWILLRQQSTSQGVN